MGRMKLFLKRLLCKHDYEIMGTRIINGMYKVQFLKCRKCGKERCRS